MSMTEQEMEQLKYPIGRYQKPEAFDESQLPEWLAMLEMLPHWLDACIENLDAAQLDTPYRPGGWNIKQVIHHVADSHMNAYIRVRLALTEDNPTITPYKENAWAMLPDVDDVPVNVSVTLLHGLHRRLVSLLRQLQPEDWHRTYYHPQYNRLFPIWEVVALYVWHSQHHTAHIRTLRDRMGWW